RRSFISWARSPRCSMVSFVRSVSLSAILDVLPLTLAAASDTVSFALCHDSLALPVIPLPLALEYPTAPVGYPCTRPLSYPDLRSLRWAYSSRYSMLERRVTEPPSASQLTPAPSSRIGTGLAFTVSTRLRLNSERFRRR